MAEDAHGELESLIRARYPIINVVSWEEQRVEHALRAVARDRNKKLHIWTVTCGFGTAAGRRDPATRDPLAALEHVATSPDQAIFLLKDFHPYISDAAVTRRLRDLTPSLKNSYKSLVLLGPILKLPAELEKEVTVVDFGLPGYDELGRLLDDIILSVKDTPDIRWALEPQQREQVLKAAQGLTALEAENVFAKSLVQKRTFDVDVILSEKEQIIRKSGILEYYPASEAFANVGGVDLLKDWMEKRTTSFTDKARDFGLPEPKGVLLIGVQGCGKSLSAKAIGALWRLPLLRLDIGKVFAGLVGASEENMRKALRVAESVAPCVLWLDELEKGLSGLQSSGSSDGGTTARVFSTFLTWLQEKTVPVFVVSTANQVEVLPPELLRKGRFDEIFFIDLPSGPEREEIFRIHLRKRKRRHETFDVSALAKATPGFSGAEIEQLVVEGLYDAFDAGTDITTDLLLEAARATVPLSMTMREKIAYLRDWASTRARPASSAEVESFEDQAASFLAGRIMAKQDRAKKAGEDQRAAKQADGGTPTTGEVAAPPSPPQGNAADDQPSAVPISPIRPTPEAKPPKRHARPKP
ncbi:MAG: AAA family ATPase [Armatimonadetes bacterium]|nr:AAA family ATPase [Armatimonadota bacterium]